MEREALLKAMKSSISDVLETMFFMPVEFDAADDIGGMMRESAEPMLGSLLRFQGPFSGAFTFIMPETMARKLTANFLGDPKTRPRDEEVAGTLMEILNMITGRAFSVYDSESLFNLGVPEMVDVSRSGSWNDGGRTTGSPS